MIRVQVGAEQSRFAIDTGRVTEPIVAKIPKVNVIIPATWDDLRLCLVVVQGPDPTLKI